MGWLDGLPIPLLASIGALGTMLEGVGLPLPGETVLVAIALVAQPHGVAAIVAVGVAAALGALAGETAGYLLGRRFGDRLLRAVSRRLPWLLPAASIDAVAERMRQHATSAIVLGRWAAVLRVLVAPLAGAVGVPPLRFALAALAGTTLWTAAIVTLVGLLGAAARSWLHVGAWSVLLVAAVAAVVGVVLVARRTGDGGAGRAAAVAARVLGVVRRVPFTVGLVVLFLAIGAATGALWTRAPRLPWFADVAYGVPQLERGAWWTPITGSLVATEPLDYATFLLVAPLAVGLLELRRGTLRAAATVVLGQLGAILGAFAILMLLQPTGWQWPVELASQLDAGPSGGYLAALVALAATLQEPWRLRMRAAVVALFVVLLLGQGTIADLEHLVGVLAVAVITTRTRRRPAMREWRLVAGIGLASLAAAQLLSLATSGPALATDPYAPLWLDLGIDLLLLLVLARPLLQGLRAAWWGAVALSLVSIVQAGLLLALLGDDLAASVSLETALAAGALWIVLLVVLVVGRRAFQAPVRIGERHADASRAARDRARATVRAVGGGTLSWMATWPDMAYQEVDGGVVALQRHGRVRIVLGDPIVPAAGLGGALAALDEAATTDGVVPCVFSASEAARRAAPDGWRSLWLADDVILDLPMPEPVGKPWAWARTALNRAAREGVEVRITTLRDEPGAILDQVRAISESWVEDKALPEMGFTLGGVREALDPEVRVALAIDANGVVQGVLSWLPVFAPGGGVRGWTLDLMRRRDGGFPPAIDLLVLRSAQLLHDEGAAFLSLSGSPLATEPGVERERTAVSAALERVASLLEPAYGFQSLHDYKRKFQPRYEPMWLLYRDEGDLAAIGVAIARAYLPGASATDLVRAGLELGR